MIRPSTPPPQPALKKRRTQAVPAAGPATPEGRRTLSTSSPSPSIISSSSPGTNISRFSSTSRSGSSSNSSTATTAINSSGGSSRSSASTASRAMSLRERIEAKEEARLKELEGMTKRHNTLFARAAAAAGGSARGGASTRLESTASRGLGILDADEDALAGPPALPSNSEEKVTARSSPKSPSNTPPARMYSASRFVGSGTRRTVSAPSLTLGGSPSTSSALTSSSIQYGSATKRQTAVLMDVLKRKSLVSRLPEIADSLYMLFTQAAAARGMSMPKPSSAAQPASSSLSSPASKTPSSAGAAASPTKLEPTTSTTTTVASSSTSNSSSSLAIPSITAIPRVPVLPLSEVLTSLTHSSRTILSRAELREALNLLIDFVPGFLEIRKVGQGGAEWATLGFGRGGGGGTGGAGGASSGMGLKEVRERLKALV